MSRVFSAMTGTGGAAARVAVEEPPAAEAFVEDGSPFVEIGGPNGPVFSPKAEPKKPEPRSFPRIVPPPAEPVGSFLSVRFHDAVPRPAVTPGGPDPALVALHFPDHPVSAEYRALRDQIGKQLPDATSRAVSFTAAAPDAGTTTVLLNLALTLARDAQRVLVIDANFTRPGVAAKLALRSSPGLAEVLGQHLPLPWALQPTAVPNLQALVSGTGTDDTGAAIGAQLPKLLGQLRQWFDWVLIDAGVWGVVPERDATCTAADAVYLVTREGDAERPEFAGLKTWVKQLGGALRGYVTTRA